MARRRGMREGRLQGAQDIPLNDLGRRQAAECWKHPRRSVCAMAASNRRCLRRKPVVRARCTMELVRAALKLPPSEYALDDRLREIGYGAWEGSTLAESQGGRSRAVARRPDGEMDDAARRRRDLCGSAARMRDWYGSLRGDTVAVAHGGTARALMVALGIETPTERRRPHYRTGRGLRVPRRGIAEV